MSAPRLLCALLLLLATHARAADCPATLTAEQQAEYDTLTKKGVVEFELQHWDEAKVHFTRAHALLPNARTLRALGLIAFEQRSYVAARELLSRALDSRCRALTQTMRDDAGKLLADARSFISDLKLVDLPAGAVVSVDDDVVQVSAGAIVQLDPGTHEIRVQVPGQAPQLRSVRASSGEPVTLALEQPQVTEAPAAPQLAHAPEAPQSPVPASAPEAATRGSTQRWVALGMGAGGVVALGVGIVSSVLAVSTKHQSDKYCMADACQARGAELRDTATSQADVATVSFIAAGALLGGALATYLLVPGSERAPTAGLRITPVGVAASF